MSISSLPNFFFSYATTDEGITQEEEKLPLNTNGGITLKVFIMIAPEIAVHDNVVESINSYLFYDEREQDSIDDANRLKLVVDTLLNEISRLKQDFDLIDCFVDTLQGLRQIVLDEGFFGISSLDDYLSTKTVEAKSRIADENKYTVGESRMPRDRPLGKLLSPDETAQVLSLPKTNSISTS